MDVLLIAGLWLPASAWSDVVNELEGLGHRPLAVELPGVDDGSTSATLDDQLNTVLAAVDAADRPFVVGHSAACSLAWLVADRRPDSIAGVALIGGFPTSNGETYAEFFPFVDGVMAFPGWEPFEGPDSEDLDERHKVLLARQAVPVAGGVASGVVRLTDDRRFAVPTIVVCPEFSAEQAKAWIDDDQSPELKRVENISYVDIDSGHWPMTTRPGDLARLLDGAAAGLG